MTRIQQVNRWLKACGVEMTLRRDPHGYFYFSGNDANAFEPGVYVYRQDHLSLAHWQDEARRCCEENKRDRLGPATSALAQPTRF